MKDVNVLNNDELLQAVAKMREDATQENQSHVLDIMVEAQYLAPVSITPEPETEGGVMINIELPPDAQIRFHMIENASGERFFLAFSSFEEMAKWRQNANMQTIIVSFDDYAGMLQRAKEDASIAGFVIDPFGMNLIFGKEQTLSIKEIKDKYARTGKGHQIKEGQEIYVGEPLKYPTELAEALKVYFQEKEAVSKAYLQLMCQEEDESYLLILDCEGEKQTMFDEIAELAKPYLGGMLLDIMDSTTDLGAQIARKARPFYQK